MAEPIVEQLRDRAKRYHRDGQPTSHCHDARLDERAADMIERLRAQRDELDIVLHKALKALSEATGWIAQEARRG